jgi:hypothetical protein
VFARIVVNNVPAKSAPVKSAPARHPTPARH